MKHLSPIYCDFEHPTEDLKQKLEDLLDKVSSAEQIEFLNSYLKLIQQVTKDDYLTTKWRIHAVDPKVDTEIQSMIRPDARLKPGMPLNAGVLNSLKFEADKVTDKKIEPYKKNFSKVIDQFWKETSHSIYRDHVTVPELEIGYECTLFHNPTGQSLLLVKMREVHSA